MSARVAAPAAGARIGAQLLRLVPLRLYGRLVPREVIGFCWHVASDGPLPHVRHLYPFKTPAQLAADLAFLRARFRVVSYPELAEARRTGKPLGPNAVFLSFDDAFAECFTVVRPLLLEHGLPCTFFLPTAVLDNRWMLAPHRVSLLVEALGRLPAAERDEVLREFGAESVEALSARLRRAARAGTAEEELGRLCARLAVDVAAYLAEERPYLTREQARTMAEEGFTLGAHSRTHPHLGSRMGDEAWVEDEIAGSCREVAALAGEERVPFAFPYDADGVERGWLRGMLARNPHVGLLFGVGQLRAEGETIVNRMIADTPPALGRARSNLPSHLRSAYAEELAAGRRSGGDETRGSPR